MTHQEYPNVLEQVLELLAENGFDGMADACPRPRSIGEPFSNRFKIEGWWTIHHGLSLGQCLKLIGEDGPFTLV